MEMIYITLREIAYRKLHFLLSLLSIIVAVGSFTGALVLLRDYDMQTQEILGKKQAEVEARITRINNDVRKAMSKLGFNIIILPRDQNLGDWYAQDYASKFMSEKILDQLAESELETIEHLVPCLRQKIKWQETGWTVLLMGVGESVANPALHEDEISFGIIPPESVVLGYEIHNALGFTVGRKIKLRNKAFTVHKCAKEHGTKDDVTIWLNLPDAQSLLGREGLINEIRALEAQCAWSDISKVREEITKILPETQVIEVSDIASAKTAARSRAIEEGKVAVDKEHNHRKSLKTARIRLAWSIVPIVLVICTGWLGLLSFRNVQDRRVEIGVFMSLGYHSGQIMRLFLLRSFVLVVCGGFAGVLCARAFGVLDSYSVGLGILLAIAITLVATYVPALFASRQDPADVLRCD